MARYISIDPGTSKCGMILADQEKAIIIYGKVIRSNYVINLINLWNNEFPIDLIILGNGTSSNYWQSQIESEISIPLQLFEEKNTTLRARDRYWELWQKNFLLRLIPKGLIIPSDNLDAIAALVLLEDFLNIKFSWKEKVSFKTWPE